jgi:hypothetical protein
MKEIKAAVDFAIAAEEMTKEEFLNFVEGY